MDGNYAASKEVGGNRTPVCLDLLKAPVLGRDLPDPVFLVFTIANGYKHNSEIFLATMLKNEVNKNS